MAKGASGLSNEFSSQAVQNVKGMTGYSITTATNDKMELFFTKKGDGTYYSNSIDGIMEQTPNNMTEKQMIQRIEENGGSTDKYTKSKLIQMEEERLKNKKKTNDILNQAYARNRGGDDTNKVYRNALKAQRIAKRR